MEKKVKWMTQYSKLFAKAMKKIGRSDYKKLENLFRNRYMDSLCSDEFEEYKKYGTMPIEKVYAAITYAKICLEAGISLEEAMRIWQDIMHVNESKIHQLICKYLDSSKNGYKKLANNLENEARKSKADGSRTFELLERSDDKMELKVTRCAYREIFESYGLGEFYRVFCGSAHCLGIVQKSTKLVKHTSLADSDCCYMELKK